MRIYIDGVVILGVESCDGAVSFGSMKKDRNNKLNLWLGKKPFGKSLQFA